MQDWQLPIVVEAPIRSTLLVDVLPRSADNLRIRRDRLTLDEPNAVHRHRQLLVANRAHGRAVEHKDSIGEQVQLLPTDRNHWDGNVGLDVLSLAASDWNPSAPDQ